MVPGWDRKLHFLLTDSLLDWLAVLVAAWGLQVGTYLDLYVLRR